MARGRRHDPCSPGRATRPIRSSGRPSSHSTSAKWCAHWERTDGGLGAQDSGLGGHGRATRLLRRSSVPAPTKLTFKADLTDTRHPEAEYACLSPSRARTSTRTTFSEQAKEPGATAAVVRRGTPPVEGLPFFEVDDTLDALGCWPGARRRMLPEGTPVVAITGSSGKTSTKEMIRAALERPLPRPRDDPRTSTIGSACRSRF